MSENDVISSRIYHFIRSHPQEEQLRLFSLSDPQLFMIMSEQQSRVSSLKYSVLKNTFEPSTVLEDEVVSNKTLAHNIGSQNSEVDTSKNQPSTQPSPESKSMKRKADVPISSLWLSSSKENSAECLAEEKTIVCNTDLSSIETLDLKDWKALDLLNHTDFTHEFIFNALELIPKIPLPTLIKKGEAANDSLDLNVLNDGLKTKLKDLTFPLNEESSCMKLQGYKVLAFVDAVLRSWSKKKPANIEIFDKTEPFYRLNRASRLSTCSREVIKMIQNKKMENVFLYMTLLGHFVLRPPNEIDIEDPEDMPLLLDFARGEVFNYRFPKPDMYFCKEDFMWDCIILACCFPLDCGLSRLCQSDFDISLPIMSFTQQSDQLKRFWLRAVLCLGALRHETDSKVEKNASSSVSQENKSPYYEGNVNKPPELDKILCTKENSINTVKDAIEKTTRSAESIELHDSPENSDEEYTENHLSDSRSTYKEREKSGKNRRSVRKQLGEYFLLM